MFSNRALFEPLESRRMLSGSVLDGVLGIESPAIVQALVFVPNPSLVFNAIPDVQGTYAGSFTLQGGTGGSITVDVTGQNGNVVTGSADLNYLGTDYTIGSATGHINLHGGFLVQGSGTVSGIPFSFAGAGHLDAGVSTVTSGGFSFTDPGGTSHFGHFSLTKTS